MLYEIMISFSLTESKNHAVLYLHQVKKIKNNLMGQMNFRKGRRDIS